MGLISNPQWILAFVALLTVFANVVGLFLQSRRDASDTVTKRIEEAAKISKAAQDLLPPLEHRIDELEKDNTNFKTLVDSQAEQIEHLDRLYQEERAARRAIEADRNQLLAKQTIWQRRIDSLEEEARQHQEKIVICQTRIDELTNEITRLKSDTGPEDDSIFDVRESLR